MRALKRLLHLLDGFLGRGATDSNGTTFFDHTNYFETVPREALERILFLESDRMGHLLGAVTQQALDAQRGVVQNEKRQNDNEPYGLVPYRLTDVLFPGGHPYGHQPIGAMADLDRATLADVRAWFHDRYGPNNAVLSLAGDIDVATAKRLVARYFGDIPAGPPSPRPAVSVPTLSAPVEEMMTDRVPTTQIVRAWAVPGMTDPDTPALALGAEALGGGVSSRLATELVSRLRIATKAQASSRALAQAGMMRIFVDLREGVDPATATRAIDAVVTEYLRTGPTADELRRIATRRVAGQIKALDSVGGKAATLAEGLLFTGDSDFYRTDSARMAAVTPDAVRATMRRWLGRPAYTLTIRPGRRGDYVEAAAPVAGPAAPVAASAPLPPSAPPAPTRTIPPLLPVAPPSFPVVVRTTLSNGIPLVYAQRPSSPVTYVTVNFDAGDAADRAGHHGVQELAAAMLDEATPTLDTTAFTAARDRLGMGIGAGGTEDETRVLMDVPSVNLAPALALFGDVVRRAPFAERDLVRVRDQQVADIRSVKTSPFGLSVRVSGPLVHGPASPYAWSPDADVVARTTRADLVAFQHAWLRPDKARFFVVSDRPLAVVKAELERVFGDWRPVGPAGTKHFPAAVPASPRIVLVDLPDTPQSLVTGYMPTTLKGTDDLLALSTANDALGGIFLGRINADLREEKHWTYGASGRFRPVVHAAPYSVTSSIQTDRTGDGIAAIRRNIADFTTTKPLTTSEFDRAIDGAIRELSGRFEEGSSVLSAMMANDRFRRPDDYYATIADRYRAMTHRDLAAALRPVLDPARMIWVVVGDAAKVRPQLDQLGLPVDVVAATAVK